MNYYIVKYSGPFGFIKPWTAVRDSKTFSQQFLTASTIEGIEKKIFPELLSISGIHKIIRNKLSYSSISVQQEVTQARGWEHKKQQKLFVRNRSIIERGIMLNPVLLIALDSLEDAKRAISQSICLCRNEDILLPHPNIENMTEENFNIIHGFELRLENNKDAFLTGFNRFNNAAPMFGELEINGNPVINS